MERTPWEQDYLRDVYAKANMLQYDRLEEERVRRNLSLLAKRRVRKMTACLLLGAAGYAIVWRFGFNVEACAVVSLLAMAVGIGMDTMELRWEISDNMKSLNSMNKRRQQPWN
jgi:hypothetical protein